MSSQLEVSLMMNNMMTGMMRSVAHQVIDGCAAKYGFDASEAKLSLNLNVSQAAKKLSSEKPKKEAKMKASFPLPFNGEHSDKCCQALRQNNGLYTQCQATRKGEHIDANFHFQLLHFREVKNQIVALDLLHGNIHVTIQASENSTIVNCQTCMKL